MYLYRHEQFYQVLSPSSSLVGVATMCILLPLPGIMANFMNNIQAKRMKKVRNILTWNARNSCLPLWIYRATLELGQLQKVQYMWLEFTLPDYYH